MTKFNLTSQEWEELLTLVKWEWNSTTEEKYTEIWNNIYLKLRTLKETQSS
tara:strand:+ start:649 stop:801 length:153 start_codon:yes stop_codon:yes gene_type:complete